MEIIVDGLIYRYQTHGGVSRVFDNILPRLCDLDPELKITLFNHWDISRQLPQHKNITSLLLNKYDNWFRPWRMWHKSYPVIHNIFLKSKTLPTNRKIWLSTYYTIPPFKWKGQQVVFTYDYVHELFPDLFSNSSETKELKKKAFVNADAVICISKSTAHDLLRFYPVSRDRVFVAELSANPIFTMRLSDEIRTKINFPFILYVGTRDTYKGFMTLLTAFTNWAYNKEVKIVVVGPKWSENEVDFIKSNNLEKQLLLYRGIQDDDLCDLYNQAKACIYPSLYEGFGIPLLEAMACGCPVIASRIPSTIEVAGGVPYYFEPGNAQSLIAALDYLMLDLALENRVKQGLEKVKQYTWEETARKVYGVLKELNVGN